MSARLHYRAVVSAPHPTRPRDPTRPSRPTPHVRLPSPPRASRAQVSGPVDLHGVPGAAVRRPARRDGASAAPERPWVTPGALCGLPRPQPAPPAIRAPPATRCPQATRVPSVTRTSSAARRPLCPPAPSGPALRGPPRPGEATAQKKPGEATRTEEAGPYGPRNAPATAPPHRSTPAEQPRRERPDGGRHAARGAARGRHPAVGHARGTDDGRISTGSPLGGLSAPNP